MGHCLFLCREVTLEFNIVRKTNEAGGQRFGIVVGDEEAGLAFCNQLRDTTHGCRHNWTAHQLRFAKAIRGIVDDGRVDVCSTAGEEFNNGRGIDEA